FSPSWQRGGRFLRKITRRSKYRVFTGTLWMLSGSFCCRSCTWLERVRLGIEDSLGEPPMNEHTISPRTYLAVYCLLIALTILTVGISFLNLGAWHSAVGLTIAVCKGLLVALFFMHLLYSSKLTSIMAVASLFWLGILLTLTLTDYLTRSWLAY